MASSATSGGSPLNKGDSRELLRSKRESTLEGKHGIDEIIEHLLSVKGTDDKLVC